MQDSGGRAGKVRQNRIQTEEDASSFPVDESQVDMYSLVPPVPHSQANSSPWSATPQSEAPQPLAIQDSPEYHLPQRYNETVLTLMVRDPYWVYAYWSVSDFDRYRICRDHGQDAWDAGVKLLRVYDITDRGADQSGNRIDIGIGDHATSWYINVPAANRVYCADIVIITPSGHEVTLVRSNAVATPRDGVSDEFDEEWMVQREYSKLYWMSAGFGPSSPEFHRRFVSRLARRRLLMGSELLAAGFSPGWEQTPLGHVDSHGLRRSLSAEQQREV
jgi:hypothetical protein